MGGNLQDVMREEELAAAAARAAQPAVTDVKTAAPGAARASGWARVTAGSTPTKGTRASVSAYTCHPFRMLVSAQSSLVSVSAVLVCLAAEACSWCHSVTSGRKLRHLCIQHVACSSSSFCQQGPSLLSLFLVLSGPQQQLLEYCC